MMFATIPGSYPLSFNLFIPFSEFRMKFLYGEFGPLALRANLDEFRKLVLIIPGSMMIVQIPNGSNS